MASVTVLRTGFSKIYIQLTRRILIRPITLFYFAVLVFSTVLPGHADIYTYTDSQGVMHFTNVPTSSKYKLYIKEKSSKIVNSYSTERYNDLIAQAAKRHGVAFSLLKAMIKIESDFDPWAVSSEGAKGLMQIMPENIKALKKNIMGGARYLKQLLKRFDGKLPLALAAYNAGPNIVERYKRIPPFKETEDFVDKVMKYYAALKKG
jgi:soluble lytic murein transglycosylase